MVCMKITFALDHKEYKLNVYKDIECILIHGSYVYGDYQKNSDIDFIIIVDNQRRRHKKMIKSDIAMQLQIPKHWIGIYTKKEWLDLAQAGDYFIWSVRLHHKILYNRQDFVHYAFKQLTVYRHVRRTLMKKQYHFVELLEKYQTGNYNQQLLLYKIGHFVRNACINLCYLEGIVEYGKYASIKLCQDMAHIEVPFTMKAYRQLYTMHRQVDNAYIQLWYNRYLILLRQALDIERRKMARGFISPLRALVKSDKGMNLS